MRGRWAASAAVVLARAGAATTQPVELAEPDPLDDAVSVDGRASVVASAWTHLCHAEAERATTSPPSDD